MTSMGLGMHLQVFYSLSERHMHPDFRPSDIHDNGVPSLAFDALFLVVEHAAYLPRFHRQQASHGNTALLMVSLCLTQGCLAV